MLTSCERVKMALAHREGDRVPLDLGSSPVTGMQVNTVYLLRQALKLDSPGTPVKVVEPYQMLGEIAPDLLEALGADVVGLGMLNNMFGFRNEDWKPWMTFDGTPVLVPAGFNTDPSPNGDILMYPKGDKSARPCARMPAGGWYFDALAHQDPIDDDTLKLEDNLEEFGPVTDDDLAFLHQELKRLEGSDRAILGNFGGTSFGDIALVPGLNVKNPKGIRGIEEWYVSTTLRRHFVYRIFERQCEIALKNLEKIYAVVGDRVTLAFVTGTDFGTQNGPFISPKAYRELYKPFHVEVNHWIHTHTGWKTMIHSCGSIFRLLDDIVAAGFDVLNPVQTAAAEMDPVVLKTKYGDRLTFWGGGVDTQKTLPFGKPDEVRQQVRERLKIFGTGGGFVFNTIHNVQAAIPIENVLALYETVRTDSKYPLN
ncbi:MAG TPA: uroporphyrinogen decarboxylase family protein [Aggregatilineales bacterium]|nr:uroporphyrinogen decarboxylase family protein [Aggregatilineales bacterium]